MTRKELILIFSCFVTILAVTSYFAHLDPDWHHDGILFKPAVDVAAGLSLFKETFTQYGALTTYLQAGAVAIFGEQLIVLRLQAAGFLSLSGVLLYLIVSRAASTVIALISIGIWLLMSPYMISVFLPWSSIYALFFCLLATWLVILDATLSTRYKLHFLLPTLSGFFFSAAFWARQPYGVVFPVVLFYLAIFGTLKIQAWRTVLRSGLAMSFGFLIGILLMLWWLWSEDAIEHWWLQSILSAQTFADSRNTNSSLFSHIISSLFPEPGKIWAANSSWIWVILPVLNLMILVSLILLAALRKSLSEKEKILLILSLLGVGTWHQYYPVLSIAHTFFGATPMFATVIIAAFFLVPKRALDYQRSLLVFVFVVALFGRDVVDRINTGTEIYPKFHIEFPTLEGMAFSNKFVTRSIRYSGTETEYFSNLERFGQFLRKLDSLEDNITLLTITEDAFLPTVFRSQNAHPITVWWHWIHKSYPNHQTRVKEFIAKNRPLIEVKRDRWGWEPASWADPQSPQRVSLGFSDYVLLFESDYSDSGISQILALPEFFSEYKARLGQFQ